MSEKFEQISLKEGFMKHNGGVLFKNISEKEYEKIMDPIKMTQPK